jgi:hypothetical protein
MESQASDWHTPLKEFEPLLATHWKMKEAQKDPPNRPLMDLGTMAVMYNIHFKHYNKGRKQVTQLIFNALWKNVYVFLPCTILGLSILRRGTKGLVVGDVKGVENMEFQWSFFWRRLIYYAMKL